MWDDDRRQKGFFKKKIGARGWIEKMLLFIEHHLILNF